MSRAGRAIVYRHPATSQGSYAAPGSLPRAKSVLGADTLRNGELRARGLWNDRELIKKAFTLEVTNLRFSMPGHRDDACAGTQPSRQQRPKVQSSMQRQSLRVTPGAAIVQRHHCTRAKWLDQWRRKCGIVHHVHLETEQREREPALLEQQLVGSGRDHSRKGIAQGQEIRVDLASEK